MIDIIHGDRTIGEFDDGRSEHSHCEAFAGEVEECVIQLLEIREAIWDAIQRDAGKVGMELCRERLLSNYATELSAAIECLFDHAGYLFAPETHDFSNGKQHRSIHNYG